MQISALSSIQYNYTNWRDGQISRLQVADARLVALVNKLAQPSTLALSDPKSAALKELRVCTGKMQLPIWQKLIFRVAEFIAKWFFPSYADLYHRRLSCDLKAKNVESLLEWMGREKVSELAKDVATRQLLILVNLKDESRLSNLYSELAFSREVIETHKELTELTQMLKEQAESYLMSTNLVRRMAELMGRSGKSYWQSYLQKSSLMTPSLWTELNVPTVEGKTLLEHLLQEENYFLNKVESKYGAPPALEKKTAHQQVSGIAPSSAMSPSIWIPSNDPSSIKPGISAFKLVEVDLAPSMAAYYGSEGVIDTGLSRALGISMGDLKPSKPLRITHVGVEYGWLWKQGGLGEAIQGLVEAEKSLDSAHAMRMLFPYYSTLKPLVEDQPDLKIVHHKSLSASSYKTYEFVKNGIEFVLIDHESFQLDSKLPSIYTSDHKMRARFATFCDLSADWIQVKGEEIDVLHLHDWHVASVVESMRKNYQSDWKRGHTPAVVFTFHNNARPAQGRAMNGDQAGAYAYGIGVNPMVMALRHSDMVTTVSPSFSLEVQTPAFSEGLHTAMQVTAAQKRLVGILNGINIHNFDPSSDAQLQKWRLDEQSVPCDLTYSIQGTPGEIVQKQKRAKECLAQWIDQQSLLTHSGGQLLGKIDPQLPILYFVGRYDTAQKGVDDFESIIKTALINKCQVVFVGSQEDAQAKLILDGLVKKYASCEGLVILRDYRFEDNRYRYQQGSSLNAPIGSLVRAASDIMIVPSHFEPCGLVQFESFAFGKPVIARARGGLIDTVKTLSSHGAHFTGWQFEDGESGSDCLESQLTEAIKFMGKMTLDEKGAMSARLMAEAKHYSWTQDKAAAPSSAGQYLAVYEEAMKRRFKRQKTVAYALQDTVDRIPDRRIGALSSSEAPVKFMDQLESSYVKDWMLDRADAAVYESCQSLAHTFPDPYAQKVRSDLYREYGPQFNQGSLSLRVPAPAASQVELLIYEKEGKLVESAALKKSADGVWSISIDLPKGTLYRLKVNGQLKIDPFARELYRPDETQPPFCVIRSEDYVWKDGAWMASRKQTNRLLDARILEIHPLTWRNDLSIKTWSDMAGPLVAHMKACDFTHVELMAILSHPTVPSMGYTVSNYFATDERMGGPDELRKLIDALHVAGLGVISDFIPGHCATEPWALGKFDGTASFEISGLQKLSIQSLFFRWGHHMNLGNPLTIDMLLSSLMMFARDFHIDGFRVDAIKSILAHYDPKAARIFLRHLNSCLKQEFPDCFTVAEDYSGNSQVVQHINANGLGFNGRWDIGWKDTWLNVAGMSPHKRRSPSSFDEVKRAMDAHLKASGEVTYLSHDEFKACQPTLVELGDLLTPSQRLAQTKALLAQQRLIPGPNLLFMGCETFSDERWTLECASAAPSSPKSLLNPAAKMAFYEGLKSTRAHLGEIEAMTPIKSIGSGLQYSYRIKGSAGNALVQVNLTAEELLISGAQSSVGELLFTTQFSPNTPANSSLMPFTLRVYDLPGAIGHDDEAQLSKVSS